MSEQEQGRHNATESTDEPDVEAHRHNRHEVDRNDVDRNDVDRHDDATQPDERSRHDDLI
jgi:hypothetical protein